MRDNALPLLTFEPGTLSPIQGHTTNNYDSDDERLGNPRRWYHYVPLSSELRATSLFVSFLSC
jgi:hypothetical protein